jgi:hypothetical protein
MRNHFTLSGFSEQLKIEGSVIRGLLFWKLLPDRCNHANGLRTVELEGEMARRDEDDIGHAEDRLESDALLANVARRVPNARLRAVANTAYRANVPWRKSDLVTVHAKATFTVCEVKGRVFGRVRVVVRILDELEEKVSRLVVQLVGEDSECPLEDCQDGSRLSDRSIDCQLASDLLNQLLCFFDGSHPSYLHLAES